jgi:hypothetical protein
MIIANQLYVGKAQPGKFVFERRGENYFLTGIILEGSQWGFSLPVSRRKSEKNLAAVEPKIVELPISKD